MSESSGKRRTCRSGGKEGVRKGKVEKRARETLS